MARKPRQMTIEYLQELQAERQREIDQITATLAMMGIPSDQSRRAFSGKLRAARTLRASANGDSNGNGHAPKAKATLQKAALTLAVLQLLERSAPLTLVDIIAGLPEAGLTRPHQLSGASAKWVHAGWLKRRPDKTFRITAAGKHRIKELQQQQHAPQ